MNEHSLNWSVTPAMASQGSILDRLRAKYDVRGPRYTSYPPANHFGAVDVEELHRRWALRQGQGLSVYVHVPFCQSRCLFCGCHSYVCTDQETLGRYVDHLRGEIAGAARVIGGGRPLEQIALGGGTPNSLSLHHLETLLGEISSVWADGEHLEGSVEIDPRTATTDQLDLFLAHRFQRFSLGVQDLSRPVLNRVGRPQNRRQVRSLVGHLRHRGCDQINFDLIYGLPGQTVETAQETARQVIELRPSRIALYSYAHVPWLRPHQKALEAYGLPSGELKVALFRTVADALVAEGYEAIGMDHFALPEDSLAIAKAQGRLRRNFMGYTTGKGLDVLGLGASAISSIGATYAQNFKDLDQYGQALDEGHAPIQRGYLLSPEDELRRELLQDLSCNFRVDLAAMSQAWGRDVSAHFALEIEALNPLVDDGLVEWQGATLVVTDVGRLFVRNVCMVFDQYLSQGGEGPAYSRTV